MTTPPLLVYGAYGFTGRLILENLRARGIDFVVAGRDASRVERLASAIGAPHRVFPLTDDAAIDRGVSGVEVLLNAAGPFGETTGPLVRSCLRSRVHYLDVSGEVAPMEYAARLDAEARSAGVMILPAVGFDVVPSDCLAVHIARRLPGARELVLGVRGVELLSRGSALTFARHVGVPVFVRKAGVLEPMRLRAQFRWIDFGDGHQLAVAVSWGDLVTAYRSTGIPDIEVYFDASAARAAGVVSNQAFGWAFRAPWARSWLRTCAGLVPDGPAREQRKSVRAVITAEGRANGHRVRARLVTPEPYEFTGIAAAAVAGRVLAGAVVTGFQTPGSLLGPDFVLSLPGVEREDLA